MQPHNSVQSLAVVVIRPLYLPLHVSTRCKHGPCCAVCKQVRQLLLDPAVQQEFVKLRRELEDHKSIIQQLKEQNDSLTFTAVRGNKGWITAY